MPMTFVIRAISSGIAAIAIHYLAIGLGLQVHAFLPLFIVLYLTSISSSILTSESLRWWGKLTRQGNIPLVEFDSALTQTKGQYMSNPEAIAALLSLAENLGVRDE